MTPIPFYLDRAESPYIGVPSGLDEYHRRVAKVAVTRALSDVRALCDNVEPGKPLRKRLASNIELCLERALKALEILG